MFQQAVYDGLWSLLADTLAEQQRLIQAAWELPDKYVYDTPDGHERTHTVAAIIAVYTEAQQDIIRACGQGWYSEDETRMCYWPWVRRMERCREMAHWRLPGETDVSYQRDRRYNFLRAHLWAALIRRMKPVYEASRVRP